MKNEYTEKDKQIDKYLGTNNLRPGPPKRLINKNIIDQQLLEQKKKIREEKKTKINYFSLSLKVEKGIKWGE